MTPIQASKKIIVNGDKQTVVQDYALIHKRSRAGKNGKNIMCPVCGHIHRIHHEYFSPFSWVTQYEHPLELFAVSALSLVVPISLGLHPFTEWVWLLLAIQLSVDAHSGYDFCVLDKLPFLFFWGGNKHHDIHHQKPKTNFQPFFTWFDIYHGTNCNICSDNATASRKKKGE